MSSIPPYSGPVLPSMLWITVFADKSEGGEWFLQENLSNVALLQMQRYSTRPQTKTIDPKQ
jgi:hypothetical protein